MGYLFPTSPYFSLRNGVGFDFVKMSYNYFSVNIACLSPSNQWHILYILGKINVISI